MSRGGRDRLQRRDVAAVTVGAEIAVLCVGESIRRERRARQDTRSFSLRAHQKPEDHRILLDLFGEAPVVVERGAHPLQESLKRRVVAQFAGGGRFEDRQAGVRARLGKGNVEANDAHLVAREELMQHQRELVAIPGPVPLGAEASFVDVDDHDAWVARSGQEQADSRVVDPEFELGQRTDLNPARGVYQHAGDQRQSDSGPNEGAQRELRDPAGDRHHGAMRSEGEA